VPLSAHRCCGPEEAEVEALRRLRETGIGSLCLAAAAVDQAALEGKMQAAGLHGPVLAPLPSSGSAPPEGASAVPSSSLPQPSTAPAHMRWYALCSQPPPAESALALRAGGTLIACPVGASEPPAGVDLAIYDAGAASSARLVSRSG